MSPLSATELYEAFEPKLNAGEIELPDIPKLTEQLTLLVLKGAHISHPSGEHDDWANAVAGAAWCATSAKALLVISDSVIAWASTNGNFVPGMTIAFPSGYGRLKTWGSLMPNITVACTLPSGLLLTLTRWPPSS